MSLKRLFRQLFSSRRDGAYLVIFFFLNLTRIQVTNYGFTLFLILLRYMASAFLRWPFKSATLLLRTIPHVVYFNNITAVVLTVPDTNG